MFLSGKIGKATIKLLKTSPLFNRHFVVVQFVDAFKILRFKPKEELKKIKLTPFNILRLRFEYYQVFDFLKESVAQIAKHDFENNVLSLDLWDDQNMKNKIKQVDIKLTDETNGELKILLDRKVFDIKHGANYSYFISIYLHPSIKKAKKGNRTCAEGTLKYYLKSKLDHKGRRLKSKFNLSKEEAIHFYSNICYWAD